ncbi:MAG: hypothetical protein HKM01_09620 [Gallionella sp.]|nr:hypothetical protein [Gallionella sp.]
MLRYLFTLVMFVVILIEEAFWSVFETVSGFFERFKLIRKLEEFVAARSPAICLALFLIPILLMLPFKFVGVWLIARGHPLDGLFVFLLAKATGTFLAARLLAITKNKLMTIRWFAYCFEKFIGWKDGVKNYIHATASYQAYRRFRDALDAKLEEIFKREK